MQDILSIELIEDLPAEQVAESDEERARVMRRRHRFMLGLSIGVIAAALLLRVGEGGYVQAKGLPSLPLPVLCGSRALLGLECPGCGLTRSFVALAAGDFRGSLTYHRVGWVLALALVLQIPYRLYLLWELRSVVPDRTWPVWFGRGLIALLIGNWVYGLL